MNADERDRRIQQLLRSPGGCALLIEMEVAKLTSAEVVEPLQALHLVAMAAGEHLCPWWNGIEVRVPRLLEIGGRLRHQAEALIDQPGIEAWWAPLDRDNQIWMEGEMRRPFPTSGSFDGFQGADTRMWKYTHSPFPAITTSTRIGGSTSQVAVIVNGSSDWWIDRYAAERRRVAVSPAARVREIDSAEDWHAFVTRYPMRAQPEDAYNLSETGNHPWGPNDGLVPDWAAVANDWDGVHVTLWAFLTATQVRITSDAGWTEPWAWTGEETTWLGWVFDEVEELPLIQAEPNEQMHTHDWRKEVTPPTHMHSVFAIQEDGSLFTFVPPGKDVPAW
jgi:hypothetical protein